MNASFVVKTPDLVRWNNVRMLGLRGREEQLNSKIQNFKDQVNYLECLTCPQQNGHSTHISIQFRTHSSSSSLVCLTFPAVQS